MDVYGKLKARNWVDCNEVQEYFGIDFRTAFRLFEFSRTVEWNPPPLNGQRATTMFRLKETDTIYDIEDKIKTLKGGENCAI